MEMVQTKPGAKGNITGSYDRQCQQCSLVFQLILEIKSETFKFGDSFHVSASKRDIFPNVYFNHAKFLPMLVHPNAMG